MAKGKSKKETPLMGQYNRIKAKYPDAILLFRVGDFYETFGQDAIVTADVVGIVLTARNNGGSKIELAGFPHHSLDTYLPKLVKAGYRVAICDQLEDPKATKTIVKRGVTELITPGVALSDKLLDHKTNNFLSAVFFEGSSAGAAFLDISTGEFFIAEGKIDYIDKLMNSLRPAEIIYSRAQKEKLDQQFGDAFYTYALEDWILEHEFAYDKLKNHFGTSTLKGFGVEGMKLGITAAGAAVHYMAETEHPNIAHISKLSRIEEDKYVWIDRFTIRNLELIHSQHVGGVTLLDVMDKTVSPMGSRLLKRWVVLPLKDKQLIEHRQQAVGAFLSNTNFAAELTTHLKQIGDLERMVSKISAQKASPRDVVQLRRSLEVLLPIKELLESDKQPAIKLLGEQLLPCDTARQRITTTLMDEVPAFIGKGEVIRDGVTPELDELRNISKNGKKLLLEIQQREIEATGITSLKIGFNNVFGYFLEVTNRFKEEVPETWIRKQTLTNSERYITDELKQLEDKILGAEDKILEWEQKLFSELLSDLMPFIEPLQQNAAILAQLDCLLSFAHISEKYSYCQPEITDGLELDIQQGRHPVIEQQLPLGESYVPNDVFLNNEDQQIIVITGPNMSGKSAILRQTALIVLMAQMGCYVPAEAASIGLVDKVFTRVGASDNLSMGESTFMVEMLETSSIMNNISDRSLILLDEIGRGTSTYDGISIAWSIAEYLHQNPEARPKTLFATHYHELNELADSHERVRNFHVATKEVGDKVIFLRKLTAGGSQHSFGIHVAKLAGMPKWIVDRAQSILGELEQKHMGDAEDTKARLKASAEAVQYQLSIFDTTDPATKEVLEELENIDLNTMTPVEAMMKLSELKGKRGK